VISSPAACHNIGQNVQYVNAYDLT